MAMTVPRTTLPSLREMLTAVFKDRLKILWSAGTVMVIAVIIALGMTPQYEASSSLLVLIGSEYTVRTEAGQQSLSNGTLDRDQIMKSEIEILSSQNLHEAVIRTVGLDRLYPALAEPRDLLGKAKLAVTRSFESLVGLPVRAYNSVDPVLAAVGQFESHLDLVASKDRGVIDVGFKHPDPKVAADVVNTLVKLYIQRRQELFSDVQSSILDSEVKGLRQQLDAADEQLAQYKAKNNISDFGVERDILLRERGELAKELLDTDSAVAQGKQRIAGVTSQLAGLPAEVTAYSETNIDQRSNTLRQSIADLQGRQAALLAHYLPDSRPVQDLIQQIKTRQDELTQLKQDKTASDVRTERNPIRESILLDRLRAEGDLDAAEARHNTLASQLQATDDKIKQLTESEQELLRLTRQASVIEENFRALSKVLHDQRISEDIEARKSANVRVIQPAEPPLSPRSATSLILISGLVLSLLVGLLVAILAEFLRRGFISPEKLERTLGVPVLASMPESPWGIRPRPAPRPATVSG